MIATAAIASATIVGLGVLSPPFVSAATIQFEVRLAESNRGAELTEAVVEGSSDVIYLHPETIVTNHDIVEARVIERDGTYEVAVAFTADAGQRMYQATRLHLGRPIAILLDADVISAPIVRSAIRETAVLTGDFSRADAQRIATGILGR